MLIYLAGPIRGCTDDEAITWREVVKVRIGAHNCLDPMRRDYRGREGEFVAEIVESDEADILACDFVLANCWQMSWGTPMEIYHAHSTGRPVIAVVKPGAVSPWLAYHAEIATSLEEGIRKILFRMGSSDSS